MARCEHELAMVQSLSPVAGFAANVAADEQIVEKTPCRCVWSAQTSANFSSKQCGRCLHSEAFLKTWFPCLQKAEQSRGGEARAQRRWAANFIAQYLCEGCQGWAADWRCCQGRFPRGPRMFVLIVVPVQSESVKLL